MQQGVLHHFSTSDSESVCVIQCGIAGPWRQTSVHQYAEAAFPHLGLVITRAHDAVRVKALRTISEAARPLLASSLLLLYGFNELKLMFAVSVA